MNAIYLAAPIMAEWDLVSFFNNAKEYTKLAGGAFLMLLGVVGIIYGGYLGVTKLMGAQSRQQDNWGKIAGLIIVGGALMTGGFSVLSTVASGGEKTITDLGGGLMNLSNMGFFGLF